MEHATIGSILRTTQAWCAQLCEKETLNYGIAYYSNRFANLPETNQFREVVIQDDAAFPKALGESHEWFTSQSLACHRWAPAEGCASQELTAFLERNGFDKHVYTAMALTEWVNIDPTPDVRILPARAMRAALRATFTQADSPESTAVKSLMADACDERMNDPQFDMFVAFVDGKPAGRCALYQVGDIARLMDLNVTPSFADSGADRALVAHMLSFAKRLSMRNICVQVADTDGRGCEWFEPFGFTADGTIEEFDYVSADQPDRHPC